MTVRPSLRPPAYFNTEEDCQWLRETHLRGVAVQAFRSFCLFGNEDSPECVCLYANQHAMIHDPIQRVVFPTNGNPVRVHIERNYRG